MSALTAPFRAVREKTSVMTATEKEYTLQAERLGQFNDTTGSTRAIEAKFVTAQDPVLETANGGRLPAVPLDEAVHLNKLKDELEGRPPGQDIPEGGIREAKDGTIHGANLRALHSSERTSEETNDTDAPLDEQIPPSQTSPLFPPLPLWGPPTLMRSLQCLFFRFTSFWLSLGFLLVIILGAAFTGVPSMLRYLFYRLTFRDPDASRPFYEEEKRRQQQRDESSKAWTQNSRRRKGSDTPASIEKDSGTSHCHEEYVPLEGGPDPLVCDVRYYARREGLEAETFEVQTEDGFLIELHHLYNPLKQLPYPSQSHGPDSPTVFPSSPTINSFAKSASRTKPRYPILLIHGLLQSSGAYVCTGPSSLAFYLHRAGYDVWLGNNRCGMNPRHALLSYSDPRMWTWNIRQMGVLDLAALLSRVLSLTSSPTLALVAHSQGTTQTLVALAKEQRPDLGRRISVFCALAPAAYAGPLIEKAHLKFMRVLSPSLFPLVFGIHAFIPLMMTMHKLLPGRFYGDMGYLVFSFLFDWSDARWDKGLRRRCFQFAPTYVSAESMRWWLGRDCFARQKCILATREEGRLEDEEDKADDDDDDNDDGTTIKFHHEKSGRANDEKMTNLDQMITDDTNTHTDEKNTTHDKNLSVVGEGHVSEGQVRVDDDSKNKADAKERGRYAWYDDRFPPLALWVCGDDDLVDGRKLLRRFERGREPEVRIVHQKVIEGYEHLDVIWALDVVEQVGTEIREVVWRTLPAEVRGRVRVPLDCEGVVGFGLGDDDAAGSTKGQ